MQSYLRLFWTNSHKICAVEVFHHALLRYGIQNAEMQKKKFFVPSSLPYSTSREGQKLSGRAHFHSQLPLSNVQHYKSLKLLIAKRCSLFWTVPCMGTKTLSFWFTLDDTFVNMRISVQLLYISPTRIAEYKIHCEKFWVKTLALWLFKIVLLLTRKVFIIPIISVNKYVKNHHSIL